MKSLTEDKYAFAELCKLFLGFNHIPGKASGFNPSPGDEVICLDMCLNFPQELIDLYLSNSGQGRGNVRSLRDLAHGVVSCFYDRPGGILTRKEQVNSPIVDHIKKWKKQFKP